MAKPPRQATPAGGKLYGYIGMIDQNTPAGLYEFSADGYKLFWRDPMFVDDYEYIMFDDAWYADGKVCGYALDTFSGAYYYAQVDFDSGKLIGRPQYLPTNNGYFKLAKLNTTDGYIYGYVTDDDENLFWGRANPSSPGVIEKLATLSASQGCYSLCYNPVEQTFIGVSVGQKFVSIDATDGSQTVISEVPNASRFDKDYITGLVYSPKDHSYFWNANLLDWSSKIYNISTEGEFTLWTELDKEEVLYFITPDEVSVDPDQPETPSIVSTAFSNGSLSGKLNFTMPEYYADGRDLPENVSWTLKINDEVYKTGSAKPGATVSADITVPSNGTYTFSVFASVDGVEGAAARTKVYVGNDTPLAPQTVDLTLTGITWQPVTAGEHKGYVDTSKISYSVYMNGTLLGTTQGTSYSYNLPVKGEIKQYTATVIAECNGLKSEASKSNTVASGGPLPLPIKMTPTEEEFKQLTIYDANHDGVEWYFTTPETGYGGMVIDYSIDPDSPMDDFIFLPRVRFDDPNVFYSFSFEVMERSLIYEREFVEVWLATSPDSNGLVKRVLKKTKVNSNKFYPLSCEFDVETAGEYYIGIRCVSNGDQNGIVVRNFELTDNNIISDSPGTAQNLTLTAGAEGVLNVTVAFDMPTKTFGGEDLKSDALLTATVTNGEFKATVTGTPGTHLSTVIQAVQGINTVGVVISDVNGYNSASVFDEVYCGVAIPADPENVKLTASADMMSALLSWDPVTKPYQDSGYLDPKEVSYTIYTYVRTPYGNYWEPYLEGVKGTSLTIYMNPDTEMNEYAYGVEAVNAAGSTGNYPYASAYLGTPYDLPYYEDFEELNFEDTMVTTPWLTYASYGDTDYNASFDTWWLSEVSKAFPGDYSVVVGVIPDEPNAKALVAMPRITTADMLNASLILDVLQGQGTGSITVKALVYGSDDFIEIGKIYNPQGQQTLTSVTLPFPDKLLNQQWVGIYFESETKTADDVVAISVVEITGKSGVESIGIDDVRISGAIGCVNFSNLNCQQISVFTLDGKTVVSRKAVAESETFTLQPGVYICRAGSKAKKVMVK